MKESRPCFVCAKPVTRDTSHANALNKHWFCSRKCFKKTKRSGKRHHVQYVVTEKRKGIEA